MKNKLEEMVNDVSYYEQLISEGGSEIEVAFWIEQRDSILSELRKLNGLSYLENRPSSKLKVVR